MLTSCAPKRLLLVASLNASLPLPPPAIQIPSTLKSGSRQACASRLSCARASPCRHLTQARSLVSASRNNRLGRRSRSSDLYPAAFLHASSSRLMASDASAKAASSVREIITPALLEDVRKTWYQHCNNDELMILPSQNTMMQWFRQNDEFDRVCVSRFSSALEGLKASGVDGAALLDAVQPSAPLDWLALVLLLDQIPRNAYRGPASAVVFSVFDPLARAVATRAIDAGVPQHPQIRYRIGYRMWFCLPLMHSEDVASHELAVAQIEAMGADVRGAGEEPGFSRAEGDERACRALLAEKREEVAKRCEGQLEFERKHQVIIERFGRYPHRNEALGRTPTPEEKEYLENGGDTFS